MSEHSTTLEQRLRELADECHWLRESDRDWLFGLFRIAARLGMLEAADWLAKQEVAIGYENASCEYLADDLRDRAAELEKP